LYVHLLHAVVYQDDGWTWRVEQKIEPSWGDIAAAIRRLDRFNYPFVWLFSSEEVDEDAFPEFSVMGGEGEYVIDYGADLAEGSYVDPHRGDSLVEVWRSDQGHVREEKYCSSLDTALQAARYYCEHGTLDPRLNWSPR
jgi:hypothetical protein